LDVSPGILYVLPYRQMWSLLMKLRAGELGIKAAGVIKPLTPNKGRWVFEPIGFGLWARRKDLADVAGWIRKVRRAR